MTVELGLGFGSFTLSILALGLLTPLSAPTAYLLASLVALAIFGVSRALTLKDKYPTQRSPRERES